MGLFLDLPVELLLDLILPFLSVVDCVSLCRTSKRFSSLLTEQALWKRLCLSSFPVPALITSRVKNWKNLCKELRSSHLYVWGYVYSFFVFYPSRLIYCSNIEYAWGLTNLLPEALNGYGGIGHPIPHPAHPKAISGIASSVW